MERLQAALENARRARKGEADAARPSPSGQTRVKRRTPDANCESLWAALPEFDVSHQHLQTNRIVTRAANKAALPFDILRTKVLLQMRQNNWKRLAITSPTPKAGKSTVACNLALALARQQDTRSILMDFDLREPSLSDFFESVPPHDIADLLTGDVDFADQAFRFGKNLACCLSSHVVVDPTQLLLADETSDILDRIEDVYQPDIVIFDMPSMLVNDDARAFLKNVDCALIVVRAEDTRYRQFDDCEREVAELTNVLGTMLNAYKGGGEAG
jgi:Mrp family chromosome partitioning ATPase